MAETTSKNVDSLVGRLVVEQGLATEQDVQECLLLQRQMSLEVEDPSAGSSQTSLASILVNQQIVTSKQIERLRPQLEAQGGSQQIPGYQLLAFLGSGAMARVYKARQISLDREVAIKILPKRFTSNQQYIERFYAEGKAAAKLNHNNIVGALDVGKSGEYHFFVMEYVEGETVFDLIQREARINEKQALQIVLQTARALEHAHKQGFIHRDVKPKNIMITGDGVAKLADMGLARAVSDREAAELEQGKAYGTPYYISPEQIRGDVDVDFRCDIYGLGATFYHMVTGQVPFDGPNPSAVMHKHLKEPLTPPDHINPNLSAGIGEIIEIAMAKDRDARYASTSDLLHDLEAVAAGEAPVQARKVFDLAQLAALEQHPVDGVQENAPAPPPIPTYEQPMFWAAATGWFVAIVLLILFAVGFGY